MVREVWETDLTPIYLAACRVRLQDLGYHVIDISDGSYPERWERVKGYASEHQAKHGRGPTVYVAGHINAVGKDHDRTHGLLCHDYRSSLGPKLAASVGVELVTLPEITRAIVEPAHDRNYQAAFNTIRGVYDGIPVGLCFEPFFLDQAEHRQLQTDEGLRRVGLALAMGVHAYAKGS